MTQNTEPFWLTLEGTGIRLLVAPRTQTLVDVANVKAAKAVAELAKAFAQVEEAGGEITGILDLDDPDVRLGLAQGEFRKALACLAILKWEGVPGECDDAAKRRFADQFPLGKIFTEAYLHPIEEIHTEGKGSGPAPNGTSVAGPSTAKGARKRTHRARGAKKPKTVASAHTKSTSRKPKQAGPSGGP